MANRKVLYRSGARLDEVDPSGDVVLISAVDSGAGSFKIKTAANDRLKVSALGLAELVGDLSFVPDVDDQGTVGVDPGETGGDPTGIGGLRRFRLIRAKTIKAGSSIKIEDFVESDDQSGVVPGAAGFGRIRYHNGVPAWQVSVDGGPFSNIITGLTLPTLAFLQGGNTFGALATLGTNDTFDLEFVVDAVPRGRWTTGGTLVIAGTAAAGTEKLRVIGTQQVDGEGIVADKFIRFGTADPFARRQIWNTLTNSVLRLGADTADGDPFDADSEGIVVYHPTGDQLGRMKADRFALTRASDSSLNYFRVNQDSFFYRANPPGGAIHFFIDRATGFTGFGTDTAFGAEKIRVVGDVRIEGKLTVTGVIDPTAVILSDPVAGTSLFFESNDGQTAPVSGAATGRIRYNDMTGAWEASTQTGPYEAFALAPDVVPITRTLTAGAGLTGGGDLSADRTFDVGAGNGIQVNADDIEAIYGLTADITTIEPDDAADEGVLNKAARADHRHAIAADVPVDVAQVNSEGASTSFARSNHVHGHGDQPLGDGLDHALVTPDPGGVAGFMSPADKLKLDGTVSSEFITMFEGDHVTGSLAFVTVADEVIDFTKITTALTMRWNQVAVPAGTAEVRLFDVAGAATLGTLVVAAIGLQSVAIANPGGVKLVRVQHRRVGGAGSSEIAGAVLESA